LCILHQTGRPQNVKYTPSTSKGSSQGKQKEDNDSGRGRPGPGHGMPPGRAGGRLTQAVQVDSHLSVAGSSDKHTRCLEAVAWINKFETPVGFLGKKVDHLRTEGMRDHLSEPYPPMWGGVPSRCLCRVAEWARMEPFPLHSSLSQNLVRIHLFLQSDVEFRDMNRVAQQLCFLRMVTLIQFSAQTFPTLS